MNYPIYFIEMLKEKKKDKKNLLFTIRTLHIKLSVPHKVQSCEIALKRRPLGHDLCCARNTVNKKTKVIHINNENFSHILTSIYRCTFDIFSLCRQIRISEFTVTRTSKITYKK